MLRMANVVGLCLILWPWSMAWGEQPVTEKTDRWGDSLPAGARARLGTTRWRHGDDIQEIVFSPDGQYLASRSRNHLIRLWEAGTGKLVRQFQQTDVDYYTMAFSPDGKSLAAAAGNGRTASDYGVQLWDLETGKELRRLTDARQTLFRLAFAPDGKSLHAVSSNALFTWNLDTGRQVLRKKWHNTIACSAFAPDGQTMVISADGTGPALLLLETATGKVVRRLPGLQQMPQALAFTADGVLLAASNPFEPTRLYRLADDTYRNLGENSAGVAQAFSPDGKQLATVSLGGVVRLWDIDSGEELRKLGGFHGWTNGLAFSPDGHTLALAGADSRRVILWDVPTGQLLNAEDGQQGPIYALAISRDGKLLASGGEIVNLIPSPLRLWNLNTARECVALPGVRGPIAKLVFSPEGHSLAVNSDSISHIYLCDIAHGREKILTASESETAPRFTSLSFSSTLLAAGSAGGRIHFWDPRTGHNRGNFAGHEARVTAVAFSPNGERLATASQDRTVALWQVDGRQEIWRLTDFADALVVLAFSPDGATLAVGNCEAEKNIRLFDVATGMERRRFGGNHGRLRDLAYSPDGRLLVAGYDDHTVCLWEAASGQERRCFRGHLGGVHAVAFAPDGQTVLSAGEDTSILVWNVADASTTRATLENLWHDLASADGHRADRALWQMVRRPKQTITFLEARWQPPQLLTANHLARLIHDLDDDQFTVRERAARELARHGDLVALELRRHRAVAPSLEALRRLDLLLRRTESTFCPDHVRTVRALEILECIASTDAIHFLQGQIQKDSTPWMRQEVQAILQRLERRREKSNHGWHG